MQRNGMNFDEAYAIAFVAYNDIRKRVSAELKTMDAAGLWEHLHVTDHDYADPKSLVEMGTLALALERPAMPVINIVDHIDHLPDGDLLRTSKASVNAVKAHAKNHGTRW